MTNEECLASIAKSLQTIAEILEPYRSTIRWRVCRYECSILKGEARVVLAASLGVPIENLRWDDEKVLRDDPSNYIHGPSSEDQQPKKSLAECEAIIQKLDPAWQSLVWIEVFTFGKWMRIS